MKLRNRKLNNKGFSLVELIVVVLIIAIIAVALAPQVMKWVSRSNESVDKNNAAAIKSSVNTAIASVGTLPSAEIDFYITSAGLYGTEAELNAYLSELEEIFNGDYSSPSGGGCYKVVVTATGSVTVETADATSGSLLIQSNSGETQAATE